MRYCSRCQHASNPKELTLTLKKLLFWSHPITHQGALTCSGLAVAGWNASNCRMLIDQGQDADITIDMKLSSRKNSLSHASKWSTNRRYYDGLERSMFPRKCCLCWHSSMWPAGRVVFKKRGAFDIIAPVMIMTAFVKCRKGRSKNRVNCSTQKCDLVVAGLFVTCRPCCSYLPYTLLTLHWC